MHAAKGEEGEKKGRVAEEMQKYKPTGGAIHSDTIQSDNRSPSIFHLSNSIHRQKSIKYITYECPVLCGRIFKDEKGYAKRRIIHDNNNDKNYVLNVYLHAM